MTAHAMTGFYNPAAQYTAGRGGDEKRRRRGGGGGADECGSGVDAVNSEKGVLEEKQQQKKNRDIKEIEIQH